IPLRECPSDLSIGCQTNPLLDSGTQPLGTGRTYRTPVYSIARLVWQATEDGGESNDPVQSWRADITGWVEDVFSGTSVIVELAINPDNRTTCNNLNIGPGFI